MPPVLDGHEHGAVVRCLMGRSMARVVGQGDLGDALVAIRLTALFLFIAVLTACAQDESPGAASGSVATSATTSSTVTTAAPAEPHAVEVAGPFTYMDRLSTWFQEPLVDVYAPVAEGPWPVIAVYHGFPDDKDAMAPAAEALAESGLVVFNFTWGGLSLDSEFNDAVLRQGPCTLWYTLDQAGTYGGDASRVSLFGFSAGADMATGITMKGGEGDAGCVAPPSDIPPVGVISAEGDYFLAPDWNRLLGLDRSIAEVIPPWRFIDDYAGPPIHLMFDEHSRAAMVVGDVPEGALADFIALRDPDGTLARDLEARGALADNVLDWGETTQYLHDRLIESGAIASLTWTNYGVHEVGPETMLEAISLAGGNPATFSIETWISTLNE